METASQIIEALGGTAHVSAYCQTTKSAVSNWKARNCIPADRWPAMIRLAAAAGLQEITLDLLERRFSSRLEAA
jgi:hypothetical protein